MESAKVSNTAVPVEGGSPASSTAASDSTSAFHSSYEAHESTANVACVCTAASEVPPVVKASSVESSGTSHSSSGREHLEVAPISSAESVADQKKLDQRRAFLQNMNQLKRTGWYWGPLTIDEAERLLMNRQDGSFLVRDSGHELYILSLSFRAQNRIYHTRIEHSGVEITLRSSDESGVEQRLNVFRIGYEARFFFLFVILRYSVTGPRYPSLRRARLRSFFNLRPTCWLLKEAGPVEPLSAESGLHIGVTGAQLLIISTVVKALDLRDTGEES
ncbi:unnamed protein product [Dibothriocephalus latus]|uniref:SH2 domain-containing protein n=1 Tax=Dibothriocephalus latus TaxID=60516 RepID=A0A3P6PN64_DIBLA|nr:unnamed protein product [Dibothriocephalus latus]